MMMRRRELLTMFPCFAGIAVAQPAPRRIIDTHTHFYDTSRPGGVPWPPKSEPILYRPVLPPEYRLLTAKWGIVGTIAVEASPLVDDNQWVLDLAEKEPIIVGTVGHLEPGKPDFPVQMERFARNARFRGIRIGTAWGKSRTTSLPPPLFFEHLKQLRDAGLELDLIGDGENILPAALAISDRVPGLRIILDHLPFNSADQSKLLPELVPRKQVFAKVSNVPRQQNGTVRKDLAFYRPALDEVYGVFGPDRVIYGSNWPVSEKVAPFDVALRLVTEYFEGKGNDVAEKYFSQNARAAYRFPLASK